MGIRKWGNRESSSVLGDSETGHRGARPQKLWRSFRIIRKFLTLTLLVDVRKIWTRLREIMKAQAFSSRLCEYVFEYSFLTHLFLITISRGESLGFKTQMNALDWIFSKNPRLSVRFVMPTSSDVTFRPSQSESRDCRPVFGSNN